MQSNNEQQKEEKIHSTGFLQEVKTTDPEAWDWKTEFREYFQKSLKPKKPTMGNLDMELCIDFIERVSASRFQEGYEKGLSRLGFTKDMRKEVFQEGVEQERERVRKMIAVKIIRPVEKWTGHETTTAEEIDKQHFGNLRYNQSLEELSSELTK